MDDIWLRYNKYKKGDVFSETQYSTTKTDLMITLWCSRCAESLRASECYYYYYYYSSTAATTTTLLLQTTTTTTTKTDLMMTLWCSRCAESLRASECYYYYYYSSTAATTTTLLLQTTTTTTTKTDLMMTLWCSRWAESLRVSESTRDALNPSDCITSYVHGVTINTEYTRCHNKHCTPAVSALIYRVTQMSLSINESINITLTIQSLLTWSEWR